MAISLIIMVATLTMISRYFPDRKSLPLMWSLLVIFMKQKLNTKLASDRLVSLRTLLIVWQFGALILTTMYSGFIFKTFASPKKLNTIDKLKDLAAAQKLGQIDVYVNINSARYTHLKVFISDIKNIDKYKNEYIFTDSILKLVIPLQNIISNSISRSN